MVSTVHILRLTGVLSMKKSPEYKLKVNIYKNPKYLDLEVFENEGLILFGTAEINVDKLGNIDLEYITCNEINEFGDEETASPYRFENYIEPSDIYEACLDAYMKGK